MKLTNTIISQTSPTEREIELSDDAVSGLKVRIGISGTKTFYLVYRNADHKKCKYRIGKFGDIGLPAAREAARKLKAEVALGKDPQADRRGAKIKAKQEQNSKLKQFLDGQYYSWADEHQKSPWRTRQIVDYNFDHYMNKPMKAITNHSLDKWQEEQLKRGIKPSTINRAITALKAVLNKAVEWEVIDENPIAGRKKMKTDSRGVVRYLTADEEKKLYKALKTRSGQLPVITHLLLNTGARPAEAFNLKWQDVDLTASRITLHAAFTKTGQTRYVPINKKLHEVLTEWEGGEEWLFPNKDGDAPITTIQKAWNNLMKDAGIKNFRLYDCRHHFASKLVMNGVDLYTVAELLGHSSTDMTRIYAHLSPDHLQHAVSVLT